MLPGWTGRAASEGWDAGAGELDQQRNRPPQPTHTRVLWKWGGVGGTKLRRSGRGPREGANPCSPTHLARVGTPPPEPGVRDHVHAEPGGTGSGRPLHPLPHPPPRQEAGKPFPAQPGQSKGRDPKMLILGDPSPPGHPTA